MHALVVHSYGRPDDPSVLRLSEKRIPHPGSGEVLIQVSHAALNRFDVRIMEGEFEPFASLCFPYTPGMDFSGVVVACGKESHRFHPGDEVMGRVHEGACAGYVIAEERELTHKPARLSFAEAACIPVPCMTALQAFHSLDLSPESRLLVLGGDSSVGRAIIQVAKHRGVVVVATCDTDCGADEMLSSDADWETVLCQRGRRVNNVIDTVGDDRAFSRAKNVLRDISHATYLTVSGKAVEKRKLSHMMAFSFKTAFRRMVSRPNYVWLWLDDTTLISGIRVLEMARELCDKGVFRALVGSEYPLDSFREAFAALAQNHGQGRVVLKMH